MAIETLPSSIIGKMEHIPLIDFASKKDYSSVDYAKKVFAKEEEKVTILEPIYHSSSSIFSSIEVLLALFTYCVSSILMTLVNKYILSELQFTMNFLLLAIQSLVCVVLLIFSKSLGLINYKPLNRKDVLSWMPISLLLVIMIYTGSKSLQFLSISVFTIFKNMTIIIIAYGDKRYFRGAITPLMVASFILMITSSILGSLGDLTFNFVGYMWMVINCVCTAAYVLFMRFSIKKIDFKDFDTVFYNNFIAVPILFFCSVCSENWHEFIHTYLADVHGHHLKNVLYVGMLVGSISAFMISYSSAWCVRVASSTTYSMVGALNKLPVAVSGMIFIPNERNVSLLSLSSVIVAFISGLMYSKAQIDLKNQAAALKSTSTSTSTSTESVKV